MVAVDKVQVNLLSLAEIAAWQIAHSPAKPNKEFIAELPAIQRGAVWKTKQIEELWDSIIQGFPIGAFLLSQICDQQDSIKRGRKDSKYQEKIKYPPTHHILDGQQRATAIALGFLDTSVSNIDKGALWLDLAPPPKGRDVEFVFRVLTRSHPWGYKRSDPSEALSIGQIREALDAFRDTNPTFAGKRPKDIPLSVAWPRESDAPIPVALIINTLFGYDTIHDCKSNMFKHIKLLPFWHETKSNWHKKQKSNLIEAFTEPESMFAIRLDKIIDMLSQVVGDNNCYGIPILILPHPNNSNNYVKGVESSEEENTTETPKDPIETLFIRINSGGTPLEGEELIYSLIKSHWTEAPIFIDKLTNKLATHSRIALMCVRLVLASTSEKFKSAFPATPEVAEFRRLMQAQNTDKKFVKSLQAFVKGKGKMIFENAHKLLTQGENALPPVLAMEITQKTPDVFFLFLRWIERMLENGLDPFEDISKNNRAQMVGFISAIAWFAPEKTKAVASIWEALQHVDTKGLPLFFEKKHFIKTLDLTDGAKIKMIPLPSPELLREVLATRIIRGASGYPGIGSEDSHIWNKWKRFDWIVKSLPSVLTAWYKQAISKQWITEKDERDDGLSGFYRESWSHFLNTLWSNRSIILYAQREHLSKWFEFDTSLPEHLEDKNRPWDIDHIHPQNYLRTDDGDGRRMRKIPRLIKDWHSSIGNLRAWPLEANRASGDIAPINKLTKANKEEIEGYGLKTHVQIINASVITKNDFKLWKKSTPEKDFHSKYLADSTYHDCRKALIEAIINRFIAIYREWYVSLEIGKLSP